MKACHSLLSGLQGSVIKLGVKEKPRSRQETWGLQVHFQLDKTLMQPESHTEN